MTSYRYTARDVDGALEQLVRVGIGNGMAAYVDGLFIEKGSPTYGRAWRMYRLNPHESGHFATGFTDSSGYLGWSAREAVQRLDAMRHTLEMVAIRDARTVEILSQWEDIRAMPTDGGLREHNSRYRVMAHMLDECRDGLMSGRPGRFDS